MARISSWALIPLHLRLHQPLATAHGTMRVREGALLLLHASPRLTGRGECTPLPAFSLPTLEEELPQLQAAMRRLSHVPETLAQLEEVTAAIPTPAARHAVELACLDVMSQQAGLPLCRFLAPDAALQVPVNALLAGDGAVEEARRLWLAGWRVFKLKVGVASPEVDIQRVQALRNALPDAEIRLDANGAWGEDTALHVLDALQPCRIRLCEQPTTPGDIPLLARVARRSPIPIAADESLSLPGGADAVLATRAAQVLILKPMVLGGVLAARKVALQAHAMGLASVVTSSMDGVVARAGALHLAASLPSPRLAAGLATGNLMEAERLDPFQPVQGVCRLGLRPGLLPAVHPSSVSM